KIESGFWKSRSISPTMTQGSLWLTGAMRERRSYKEVLKNSNCNEASKMSVVQDIAKNELTASLHVEARSKDLQWLSGCYVGETYAIDQVPGL
ncbi:hypothetical protein Ancab_032551, partial [Ancistrocladus abbreviatus]